MKRKGGSLIQTHFSKKPKIGSVVEKPAKLEDSLVKYDFTGIVIPKNYLDAEGGDFQGIPLEILRHLLSYLRPYDRTILVFVCKFLSSLIMTCDSLRKRVSGNPNLFYVYSKPHFFEWSSFHGDHKNVTYFNLTEPRWSDDKVKSVLRKCLKNANADLFIHFTNAKFFNVKKHVDECFRATISSGDETLFVTFHRAYARHVKMDAYAVLKNIAKCGDVGIYKRAKKFNLLTYGDDASTKKKSFRLATMMAMNRGHLSLLKLFEKDGISFRHFTDANYDETFHYKLGTERRKEVHDYIWLKMLDLGTERSVKRSCDMIAEYMAGLSSEKYYEEFNVMAAWIKDVKDQAIPNHGCILEYKKLLMKCVSDRILRSPKIEPIRTLVTLGYALDVKTILWTPLVYYDPSPKVIDFLFDVGLLSVEYFSRMTRGRQTEIFRRLGNQSDSKAVEALLRQKVSFSNHALDCLITSAKKYRCFPLLKILHDKNMINGENIKSIVSLLIKDDSGSTLASFDFNKWLAFDKNHVNECLERKAWGCLIYILNRNPWKDMVEIKKEISRDLGIVVSDIEDRLNGFLRDVEKALAKKDYPTEACRYYDPAAEESKEWWTFHAYDLQMHKDQCEELSGKVCKVHLESRAEGLKNLLALCRPLFDEYPLIKQSKIERYFMPV